MFLVLIVIGSIAGWKTGDLRGRNFALLAVLAIVPTWVLLALRMFPNEPALWISTWLVCFAYLAIPYVMLAWLKRARERNRADER
jgi:predicted MFS family arabinose efflux permease